MKKTDELVGLVEDCVNLMHGYQFALEGNESYKRVFGEVTKYNEIIEQSDNFYNRIKKKAVTYKGQAITRLIKELDDKYESIKAHENKHIGVD